MVVFNLTDEPLVFHGISIPPNGGSKEIPALDVFVSDRDVEMARKGVISFTHLPSWWRPRGLAKMPAPAPAPEPVKVVDPLPEEAVVEKPRQSEKRSKWSKE